MAEGDDESSKTEQPTGKRLGTAREEGNVAQSQEAKTAGMLLGICVFVWLIAPPLMERVKVYLSGYFEHAWSIRVGSEPELAAVIRDMATHIGLLMLFPLGFLMVVGLIVSVSQVGWLFTPHRLMPDLNRINPLTKMGKLFSMPSGVEQLKNLTKLTIVIVVMYFVLRPRLAELDLLVSLEVPALLHFLKILMLRLLFAVTLIEIAIGGADWFFQRFNFMKNLRMTKHEVKEEHKQSEGDPMIKSRLRGLRMARARQRMIAAVPKADVVVTNPTHYACALKYDAETMGAPVLVAKGRDLVALRIRQIAEENNVPVVENPPLARALYASVEIDREIPPDQYKAVAEVISYVFRLKGKHRR